MTDLEAAALEYVGTTTFLLLFLGAIQAASAAQGAQSGSPVELNLYIATSAGISLLISAWLFFRVTGAVFNPNIGLALMLCKVITPLRFVLYCIAQLVGGITAAGLVLALTPGTTASK
jgi:aquaporin rerated protein, other eukaryote